jgi:hypothetical protein
MTWGYVKTYVFTYVIGVNTSHTPEEGARHSPRWPNGLIIIIRGPDGVILGEGA